MREMTTDEKKLFDEKSDYIAKLRDSMPQSEMDGLLPREVQEMMDAPVFTFGQVKLYPRKDFNDYLESAFSGSTVAGKLDGLEAKVFDLEAKLHNARNEANGYVAEIERLEGELKEAKDARFRAEAKASEDVEDGPPVKLKALDTKRFFPGEVNAFILCMLSDWLRNHRPQVPSEGVRAYEVAKLYRDAYMEVFDVKGIEKSSEEFRKRLEKAIDDTFSTTPTDITPLLQIGFTNRTRKNSPHWKVAWQGRDDYMFVIAKTPSDRSSQENCKRSITSRLCI